MARISSLAARFARTGSRILLSKSATNFASVLDIAPEDQTEGGGRSFSKYFALPVFVAVFYPLCHSA